MAHCKNDELEIMGLVIQASLEILLLCCVLSTLSTAWYGFNSWDSLILLKKMTWKKTESNFYVNISTNDDMLECTNWVTIIHPKKCSRSEI